MRYCWVTDKPLSPGEEECQDCHDMACPVNTGFAPGPKEAPGEGKRAPINYQACGPCHDVLHPVG